MKTRFAPSLTGYLHLGHVLHMLYVWGIARAKSGAVVVRMEDHDLGRCRPEFEPSILLDMEWLGFQLDPEQPSFISGTPSVFRQSDGDPFYAQMLEKLQAEGRVYGCECSRKEILATQSGGTELCYSGTCSEKNLPLDGNTVRFRVTSDAVSFVDQHLGPLHQTPKEQCGDFSLRGRNGEWSYQFCCVCDDIRHDIDLIIRGEDILQSTGRQIQLFRALGAMEPSYFHHPLLLGEDGNKLSKRQRSQSITELREMGLAEEVVIGRALFAGALISEERSVGLDEAYSLIVSSLSDPIL